MSKNYSLEINAAKKDIAEIKVNAKNLPFSCPQPDSELWSMHPKVFLEFNSEGKALCPYCGAKYKLSQ